MEQEGNSKKKRRKGEGEQDINIEDKTYVQFLQLLSTTTKEAEDILLIPLVASTDKPYRLNTSTYQNPKQVVVFHCTEIEYLLQRTQ